MPCPSGVPSLSEADLGKGAMMKEPGGKSTPPPECELVHSYHMSLVSCPFTCPWLGLREALTSWGELVPSCVLTLAPHRVLTGPSRPQTFSWPGGVVGNSV